MNLVNLINRGSRLIVNDIRRRSFEKKIHPNTWTDHDEILGHAMNPFLESEESYSSCSDIVKRGRELRSLALIGFREKYSSIGNLRIMIHVPPKHISPGGHSLFSNLVESIQYLGIPCERLLWGEPTDDRLESFKPNVLMSSDNNAYKKEIDWSAIQKYRSETPLKVGLTASIEAYGNSPLRGRLEWAKSQDISFFYSFRSPEYLRARSDYAPFFSEGYSIHSIEFGANPLHYYPVEAVKDLSYVFLASSNPDKQSRYEEWLTPILSKYSGFLDGPGWSRVGSCAQTKLHKFLYARAKVGINLHIEDSIEWASELNERTYILAACGIPQLIDNPLLLKDRFSKETIFQANSPSEYNELFEYIIHSPEKEFKQPMLALEEVYAKHTTFHRAESLINQLRCETLHNI